MNDLGEEKLSILLDSYIEYFKRSEEAKEHFELTERRLKIVKDNFLNLPRIQQLSDEELIGSLREYVHALDGPQTPYNPEGRLENFVPTFRNAIEYLLESEAPFQEKILNILSDTGEYSYSWIKRQFWTPIFSAMDESMYPNWNGKTDRVLKKIGFSIKGADISEKYFKVIDAFKKLQGIRPELDFDKLDHFMHYLSAIDEGVALLDKLKKEEQDTSSKEELSNFSNSLLHLLASKKQIILYGPPGTGKTYNTKMFAVGIIEGKPAWVNPPVRPGGADPAEHPKAWLFQANPKYYDVRGALSAPSAGNLEWGVVQNKKNIKKGDTVFLWVSGKGGGIFAVYEIATDLLHRQDVSDDKFITKKLPHGEADFCVRMNLRKNLVDNPLRREMIENTPGLENLRVFKFGKATNFRVTRDEWKILEKLISDLDAV